MHSIYQSRLQIDSRTDRITRDNHCKPTPDFVLQIQGKDIERVLNLNYLGVMLDEQLLWKEHIDIICNKVNKRLGLLARIRSCLNLKAAKCIYNTLIEPILSYADTAWGEPSAASSKGLQRLQNHAARIILRLGVIPLEVLLMCWGGLT